MSFRGGEPDGGLAAQAIAHPNLRQIYSRVGAQGGLASSLRSAGNSMTQWAQLKGGPPESGGLERGHWYPVEAITKEGIVRVLGPSAVGVVLDARSVRVINHQPDTITRIEGTGFRALKPGQPTPMMSFYGVCPKGHRLEQLTYVVDKARCEKCGQTYRVENEELF